jgi:phosphoribosylanthranilate isomerase
MFPAPPRVKVCCIASEEEAALAVRLGASAIGLVSRIPSGPGPVPESRIRDIARTVPPGVATFLLTCETTAELIIEQQRFCRTTTLQLVDGLEQKDSRLGGRSEARSLMRGTKLGARA